MKRIFVMVLAAFLAAGAQAYAKDSRDSYNDAVRLIDSGEYRKAEEVLNGLVSIEPGNARFHQTLGDALRKDGKLRESIKEYERARDLGADNAELYKGMGTSYKWLRQYEDARSYYRKALQADPSDREARDDLQALSQNRGLRLSLLAGGWEPDYTTKSYEAKLSYGGFDKIDLNAGYGYADQIYYTRHKVYANGYYFYNPESYAKLSISRKNYNYPVDPAVQKPNPDSTSYDIVPSVELEVSHWLRDDLRGTLAYEYFRPSFFYDKSAHANNHKVSAEAYYITPLKYLRVKALYAVLRDPDSGTTEIKGRDNPNTAAGVAQSTDVRYKTESLIGGGAEVVKGKWDLEATYMPNRDLDASYSYSILAGAGYGFTDRVRGRFDLVHDEYSTKSTYSGRTADVYLASVFYKLDQATELGAGYKRILLPSKKDNAAFLTVSYKTGLGF